MLLKKTNGELTMFKPEGRPLDLEHGSILCIAISPYLGLIYQNKLLRNVLFRVYIETTNKQN